MELRPLELRYHSPKGWADVQRRRAIDLGCSEEYADRLAAQIIERSKIVRKVDED